MKGAAKESAENLTAEADFPVIKGLSRLERSPEKLEAVYLKGLDIKLLTKNIEFIDDGYLGGGLVGSSLGRG